MSLQSLQTALLSTQAQHKKEVTEYQSKVSKLVKQVQVSDQKARESSAETKKLRGLSEYQEKEIQTLRKQVETLLLDNQSLQTKLQENQNLVKRLEFKFGGGRTQWLVQKNSSMTDVIDMMKREIDYGKTTIDEQQQTIEHYRQEIDVLTTALAIRSEEFGMHGDLKTVLLYDLAKSRDEVANLALELAEKVSRNQELEGLCESLQNQMEQLVEKLKFSVQESDEFRTKLREVEESKSRLIHDFEEQQSEKKLMLAYIKEEIEKSSSTKELLHRLTTEQSERENLLQRELDQAKAEVAKIGHIVQSKEEAMKELDILHKESKSDKEKIMQLENQLKDAQHLLSKGAGDVANLMSELEGLTDIAQNMKQELDELRREIQMKSNQLHEYKKKEEVTTQELLTLRALAEQNASELATHIYSLSEDLKKAIQERDRFGEVAREAINRSQSTDALLDKLHIEHAQLRQQVESLMKSKSGLQQTLLEQIASVKNQLEVAQESYRQTESANQRLQEENARLMKLYDEERKRSRDKKNAWPEFSSPEQTSLSFQERQSFLLSSNSSIANPFPQQRTSIQRPNSKVTFQTPVTTGVTNTPNPTNTIRFNPKPPPQRTIFALPESSIPKRSFSSSSENMSLSFPTLMEQARERDDSDDYY